MQRTFLAHNLRVSVFCLCVYRNWYRGGKLGFTRFHPSALLLPNPEKREPEFLTDGKKTVYLQNSVELADGSV